jgi:putative phosphoesterase
MRIGLISDTHVPEAPELWPQIHDAFRGVDAILHAGDIYDLGVLDGLAEIAPLYACRGNGDDGSSGRPRQPDHPCLRDHWLVELGGVTIALTHWVPVPERPSVLDLRGALDRHFGPDVVPDVVVHGDTHVEDIRVVRDILCVNPGSPTFPHNLTYQFGTVAFLDIDENGDVEAEVRMLTDDGHDPFDWEFWGRRPW